MNAVRPAARRIALSRPISKLPKQTHLQACRRYASDMPDHPPAQVGGTKGLPWIIAAVAVIIPGSLYLVNRGQKDIAHNDHEGQKSVYTSNRGMIKGDRPEVETDVDASDSDLPADAPNRPDNLDKLQKKMDAKAPTKKLGPSNIKS